MQNGKKSRVMGYLEEGMGRKGRCVGLRGEKQECE